VKVLDEIFAGKTLEEWKTTLATLDGAWAAVASPEEIGRDPQVLANGYFPEAKGENSTVRAVAAPVQFNREPTGDLRTMSEFGADTENVLLELGYEWDDVAAMKESGSIV
jgi:crotonobetainyl-CoA:carnitine CoA-transferase CaiB-like acyl-CoA transferase